MSYTPGPWELVEAGDNVKKLVPSHECVSILTVVREDGVPFGAVFREADARLIAAAPEITPTPSPETINA